ncbi:hypothetical protein KKG51_01795, partial [Patescibacteria group bacterium]|nr:hypothetical protein [Patescibacteria group bacterium]
MNNGNPHRHIADFVGYMREEFKNGLEEFVFEVMKQFLLSFGGFSPEENEKLKTMHLLNGDASDIDFLDTLSSRLNDEYEWAQSCIRMIEQEGIAHEEDGDFQSVSELYEEADEERGHQRWTSSVRWGVLVPFRFLLTETRKGGEGKGIFELENLKSVL